MCKQDVKRYYQWGGTEQMDMRINTCYVVKIQSQLDAEPGELPRTIWQAKTHRGFLGLERRVTL